MQPVAIKCRDIKKSYGKNENLYEALRDINVDIYEGQLTLLVGPSGSGKTTLLSIITMILTADSGQLFLLNQDMGLLSEAEKTAFRRDHLGIVFQSLFLIPTITVIENIIMPLLIAGEGEETATEKGMKILDRMHLANRAHSSPALLSKGQQQRIAIARAVVNDAKIIVCDEPTSALDHTVGFEIMSLLHDLARQASKAVLVVTHDHRIFPYADQIITISDGQITAGET